DRGGVRGGDERDGERDRRGRRGVGQHREAARAGDGQVGPGPGVELPDGQAGGGSQVAGGGADGDGHGSVEAPLAVVGEDAHAVVVVRVGRVVGDRQVRGVVAVEVGGHDGDRVGAGGEVAAGGEADDAGPRAVVQEDRDVPARVVGDGDIQPVVPVEVTHGQGARPGGAAGQGQPERGRPKEAAGERALEDRQGVAALVGHHQVGHAVAVQVGEGDGAGGLHGVVAQRAQAAVTQQVDDRDVVL